MALRRVQLKHSKTTTKILKPKNIKNKMQIFHVNETFSYCQSLCKDLAKIKLFQEPTTEAASTITSSTAASVLVIGDKPEVIWALRQGK